MRTFSLKIVVAFGLGLNEHLAMAVQIPFDFLVTLLGEVPARAMIAEAGLPADGTPISHLDLWQLLGNNIERTGDERHELGPQAVPNGSFELLLAAGSSRALACNIASSPVLAAMNLQARRARAGAAMPRTALVGGCKSPCLSAPVAYC